MSELSAKKHKALKLGAAAIGITGCAGIIMNRLVLTRASKKISEMGEKHEAKKNAGAPVPEKDLLRQQSEAWYEAQEKSHVVLSNKSGKHLHGFVLEAPEKTHKWALVVHGYTSNALGMSDYALGYSKMGFNILLPILRGHDISEYRNITMGWLDRLDMLYWIDYILKLDPDAEIVLHGVSMGAATVMMTTGEALPENVKCCVADCGYSSVWDEFKNELSATYKLPAFPVLYAADAATKIIGGFGFKEASSIEQLKKSKTPTLFIHGENDAFVPYRMLDLNYNAAACEKEKLSIPDAEHAESCRVHPEIYWPEVERFVSKYIK